MTVVRPTSLATQTITTHPVSTLSKAVVFTTTKSNGVPVLTTAPYVTIWSTSTNTNGTVFISTAIVANPQADMSPVSGFLHDTGAVAGIFTIVGVVLTALVVFLAIYIRRRRRSREREKWSAEMAAPLPSAFVDNPFRDENPSSPISATTSPDDDQWNPKSTLLPEGSARRPLKFSQAANASSSIFPIFPTLRDGVFAGQQGKPLLQSVEMAEQSKPRRSQALSESTPSIYPLSLSPGEEQISKDIVTIPTFTFQSTTSPLRPPRSHLRDRIKALTSRLPSPPESDHSKPTSLTSGSPPPDVPVLDRIPF